MGLLIFWLGLLLASIFFGIFPVLLVLAGSWVLDTVGTVIFVACVGTGTLFFMPLLSGFEGRCGTR